MFSSKLSKEIIVSILFLKYGADHFIFSSISVLSNNICSLIDNFLASLLNAQKHVFYNKNFKSAEVH